MGGTFYFFYFLGLFLDGIFSFIFNDASLFSILLQEIQLFPANGFFFSVAESLRISFLAYYLFTYYQARIFIFNSNQKFALHKILLTGKAFLLFLVNVVHGVIQGCFFHFISIDNFIETIGGKTKILRSLNSYILRHIT